MKLRNFFGFLLLLIVSANKVSCWDQEDLDVFDLVEEINENFYTVLKVQQVIEYFLFKLIFISFAGKIEIILSVLRVYLFIYPILIQNATAAEIRKAFRALSVVLHPDKNDAEDANVQFRNLVSVYEVLKDSSKRQK